MSEGIKFSVEGGLRGTAESIIRKSGALEMPESECKILSYGPPGCKTSSDPDYQAHRKFCKNHGAMDWEEFRRRNPQREGRVYPVQQKPAKIRRRYAATPHCMADVRAIAQLNRDIVAAKLAAKGIAMPPVKPRRPLGIA